MATPTATRTTGINVELEQARREYLHLRLAGVARQAALERLGSAHGWARDYTRVNVVMPVGLYNRRRVPLLALQVQTIAGASDIDAEAIEWAIEDLTDKDPTFPYWAALEPIEVVAARLVDFING